MAEEKKKEGMFGFEDTPEEEKQFSGEGQDRNYLTLKAGTKTRVHLLGKPKFFRYHWIQKANRTVVCPGEGCPICATGELPRGRYIMNVYNYAEKQVQLFEFGRRLKGSIGDVISEWGDPIKYDIALIRTGKGKSDTRYSAVPGKIKVKVDYDKLEKHDLEKIYGQPTVKYVEDVLSGNTSSEEGGEKETKKEDPSEKLPDIDSLGIDIEADLELD